MSDDVENCRTSQQMVKSFGYIYIYIYTHTERERERYYVHNIFTTHRWLVGRGK